MAGKKLDKNSIGQVFRVLIADDHPIFRQSVKNIVESQTEFKVIGEASNGEEVIKQATMLEPDIVLMDISMPKINGLEATKQIKSIRPCIAVLVLTILDDA